MPADATVTMKYNADTTSATKNVNTFGSAIKKAGLLLAAAFSIQKIYEIGAAFEQSFAKASTLIDETTVSLDAVREGVIELSNETGVAADEINEGLYQALSAGVDITEDGADALGFMNDMLKLAKGGFTDTATAVDVTTTMINAYGLAQEDAAKISDMLIATQNEGKTTVAELGGSLSQVIPIAAQLGIEYDQVGASIATMTAMGTDTATTITELRALFTELSKSTTVASQAFERASGQTFPEFIESGGTIAEALNIMQQYADDNNIQMIDLFSNVRSANAAMKIASEDGMSKFNSSLETITNSAGTTDEAFEKVTNTASYKMTQAFNKMKNAGIELFGALSPVIEGLATVIGGVASAISFVLEGFKGTNVAATALTSVLSALAIVFTALQIITHASTIATWLYVAAQEAYLAVAVLVEAAAIAMGVSMTVALGVIGLVIAAVAALVAVLIMFVNNEVSKEADRITDSLDEMNEAFEENQKTINAEADASNDLADELIELSKKSNKTTDDIAKMTAIAEQLNGIIGEGTVEVDANTGALKLNGEAIDGNGDALKELIKARQDDAEATAAQEAASKARTLQAEAEANYTLALEKANESMSLINAVAFLKASDARDEAAESVAYYNEQLEESIKIQQEEETQAAELEAQAAENMTAEQKRQAIRDQMNADRELSTSEHYAKLQEMMSSNYVELGLTEEEYIAEMAEHQQAIEDATQEHVNTLFGINEEGLYNEANTVAELNEIWTQNQLDMSNYYTNLNTLSEAGFDDLVTVFEDGGVEMGGSLANVMDDLQGITLEGWEEIKADWDENGGSLSEGMKEKFGDVNVEAGLAVLELQQTTEKGFSDAEEYGTGGFAPIVDSTEDTMDDVDSAIKTGGETAAETSEEAGEEASSSFVEGAKSNLGDVAAMGEFTGKSYVGGLLLGLDAMRSSLVAKAKSLAYSMNNAYKNALDIDSPSKVGIWNTQMYGEGLLIGLEDSKKSLEKGAVDLANAVIDGSNLVYTPPFMGAAGSVANNYYYNTEKTESRHDGPLLNIENYNQNSAEDQAQLAKTLEIERRKQEIAIGVK